MSKLLLLGDQAIALGAINAGLSGVYAYPGTPSTEITEYIQDSKVARERKIHSRWCTNEKTAMEAALGMSFVGKRALVCMKHVGLNVCADCFVNSAMTGVNGGLVVLVADDPSMHSSQNEQDSRFYGKFAMVPTLEPSNQQEAYDMMNYAYDLSESVHLPVLMRVTTRMAHSRAAIEVGEIKEENTLHFPENEREWVLLPVIARKRNEIVTGQQKDLKQKAEASVYNRFIDGKNHKLGIIASGIAFNYLMECFPDGCDYPVLKISQYPLPNNAITKLVKECDSLLVLEEGQPFIEDQIRGILPLDKPVMGKLSGVLPRTGELNTDLVKKALGMQNDECYAPCEDVTPRPPALCQGCGHRSVYEALNLVIKDYPDAKVFGDIGCYTLGALPPYRAISTCVDMGASVTMAKGAADGGLFPAIAVIGDSTFTHSGMTGLLDAVNENSPITIVISDNLTTAMTGGQDSAGTNKFEAICKGLGVPEEHVRVVVPLPKNMDEIIRIIREEIEYRGISVIIPRRECIQTASRHVKERAAKQAAK